MKILYDNTKHKFERFAIGKKRSFKTNENLNSNASLAHIGL